MRRITYFFCLFFSTSLLFAQADLLQSGPMLGYSEMREVALWAQTNAAAEVKFSYWNLTAPKDIKYTKTVKTQEEDAFTAHFKVSGLEPGQRYGYQLFINNKAVARPYPTTFQTQTLWQWRTDPPAFKLAIGSCAYVNEAPYDRPGNPYGGDYQIFTSIAAKQPDLMLWMGDNNYLREVDWYTRSGILYRNTHTRSLPEMQALLASTHNYAIWDDHDYGPDDSDRSFVHKDWTLEAFKLFWENPSYGLNGHPGIATQFQWADVDFFLLDDRYYRSPDKRKTGKATILGEEQLEWLLDVLAYSRAPFKIIAMGGQVLNPAPVYENYSANRYEAEREYLLKRIEEEGIKNVIFLSGDRHHTELCQYTNSVGNTVYDLTVSPLTSSPAPKGDPANTLLVEGTFYDKRNFGVLEFSGPRTARSVAIHIYDSNGAEVWTRTIEAVK